MQVIRYIVAGLVVFAFAATAQAEFPAKLHERGTLPDDFDPTSPDNWDYISALPLGVDHSRLSAYEKQIGSGLHADNAWLNYTSGDPSVVIAVFDSGIEWDEEDLINKHFLNRGELPPPLADLTTPWPGIDDPASPLDCTDGAWTQSGGEYDVNHDGVFNIKDYRCDSRVHPEDGVARADALLDPSDLIHARHTDFVALGGVDNDRNGYVDDISGWDFMWNDNDAYDDTRYSHGTGEAKGSTAEANNGDGKPGICPDCMVLNVRVSDSYVADTNNLAKGIVFAVDTGARVIQSALGPLTGSIYAQAAIDYAYDRNVVAIMSAADETSMHHFPISSGENTVMVHAVVPDGDIWGDQAPSSYLNFSNCTNYGGHLFLSVPNTHCSSGAVKLTAGVAGLLYAYAKQQGLEPLTANEVTQLLRAGADDINEPTATLESRKFPSQEGWDQYYGYGRVNVEASLQAMKEGRIPPEAGIVYPRWFQVLDPARTPTVPIRGLANAPRSAGYTYELSYAYGITPPIDAFTNVIAAGEGSGKLEELGEWDLSKVNFPADQDYGEITSANRREKVDQFTFTLRLRVTDTGGNVGEWRKTVYLRKDHDLLPGFPIDLGSSGESSPKLADINGDGKWDIVVALADGTVRVYDGNARLLPGWPARTPVDIGMNGADPARDVSQSEAYLSGEIGTIHAGLVASPAVGKLDGRNIAVVVATMDGDIVAYAKDGSVLPGFPQHVDDVSGDDTNGVQMIEEAFFASPVLYDLTGDGKLEIIAAGMDGKLYIFRHDGSRVAPFPVPLRDTNMTADDELVDDPDYPECALNLEAIRESRFADEGGGYRSRVVATPAVGDIDGDGQVEIVVPTEEIYPSFCDSGTAGPGGSSRLYAFRLDGTQPNGYPLVIPGQTAILPYVGRGIPNAAALADINSDGASDIAIHQIASLGGNGVMDWQGNQLLGFKQSTDGLLSNVGTGDVVRGAPYPLLINFGTFADMDLDGVPDYMVGGVTVDMLESMANDSVRRDHDHLLLGFKGADGAPLTGFPRVMEDIQFFMNPSVADLNGDGVPEVINGSGGFILHAWNHKGERPKGWPKFTGQWLIASPAIGDIDGDGYLEVVINSRDGFLYAWNTVGPTQRHGKNAVQWASFRHDNHNTGNYDTPLPMQPGPDFRTGGCACSTAASGETDKERASLFFGTVLMAWGYLRSKRRNRS